MRPAGLVYPYRALKPCATFVGVRAQAQGYMLRPCSCNPYSLRGMLQLSNQNIAAVDVWSHDGGCGVEKARFLLQLVALRLQLKPYVVYMQVGKSWPCWGVLRCTSGIGMWCNA